LSHEGTGPKTGRGLNVRIKLEHLIEIYRNIPQAQLGIFPGATHFIAQAEHELYNSMAERFLTRPFTRPTSKQALEELLKQ